MMSLVCRRAGVVLAAICFSVSSRASSLNWSSPEEPGIEQAVEREVIHRDAENLPPRWPLILEDRDGIRGLEEYGEVCRPGGIRVRGRRGGQLAVRSATGQ